MFLAGSLCPKADPCLQAHGSRVSGGWNGKSQEGRVTQEGPSPNARQKKDALHLEPVLSAVLIVAFSPGLMGKSKDSLIATPGLSPV